MTTLDMTGQKIGKLTVLLRNRMRGHGWWHCICDCGNHCNRQGNYLRKGNEKTSCGCTRSETMKQVFSKEEVRNKLCEKRKTHGRSKSSEYQSWILMKARCYQSTSASYQNYGGRGISVCDSWRNNFSQFLADMGDKPSPEYTLDRIDPNGNYDPENCRWATISDQGKEHKRSLRETVVMGINFPSLAAACRHFGVVPMTIQARLRKGMSIDDAFSQKTRVMSPRYSR